MIIKQNEKVQCNSIYHRVDHGPVEAPNGHPPGPKAQRVSICRMDGANRLFLIIVCHYASTSVVIITLKESLFWALEEF